MGELTFSEDELRCHLLFFHAEIRYLASRKQLVQHIYLKIDYHFIKITWNTREIKIYYFCSEIAKAKELSRKMKMKNGFKLAVSLIKHIDHSRNSEETIDKATFISSE